MQGKIERVKQIRSRSDRELYESFDKTALRLAKHSFMNVRIIIHYSDGVKPSLCLLRVKASLEKAQDLALRRIFSKFPVKGAL